MLKKVALGVVVLALNGQANADNNHAGWVDVNKPHKSTAQKVNATKTPKISPKAVPATKARPPT